MKLEHEQNTLDIRDDFGVEIHSMKSNWWMHYGILASILIVAIVVILGSIIKYPDIVYGEFRLISSTPAISIPLTQNIQIDRVIKNNNEQVYKGEHLLIYSNNANYNDILSLQKLLENQSFSDSTFLRIFSQLQNKSFNLGDLQPVFTRYYEKLFELYAIIELKKFDNRIDQLDRRLNMQYKLQNSFEEYLAISKQEKEILSKTSYLDSLVFSKQLYNEMEYYSKKEIYLNKAKSLKQQEIEIKRNELEIINNENAIALEKKSKEENLTAVRLQIKELRNRLMADLNTWIIRNVIVSPIDGTLHFIGIINDKLYINQEETIITIIPDSTNFNAIVKVPFQRAGKVENSQAVNLKLNDYPFREYGYVEGWLSDISDVAGTEYYMATITLGSELITNSNKKILAKENMSGIAEIVVNDRTLLARLFESVIYVFNR